jgi:uncharacterized NAD(P)/FAD-binding protein YdhS
MGGFRSNLAEDIEIGASADGAISAARVAIVGGGASGTLMALALTRARPDLNVTLIEPSPPGSGLAYGTACPEHRLNVLPGRLSAFSDLPDDFASWLVGRGEIASIEDKVFVRRSLMGDYLRERLGAVGPRLRIRPALATSIDLTATKARISLDSGDVVDADAAILATGHSWAPMRDQDRDVPPDGPVTIFGTGLGMVDRWLSLRESGHRGTITAISRHGLPPLSHGDCRAPLSLPSVPLGRPVSETMRWLRDLAEQVLDWRVAVDALRPHVQAIWQSWSQIERRRFLRHARRYWDVHRHRVAPDIAFRMAEEIADGRLHIASATAPGETAFTFDCRGHLPEWTAIRNPLIARLLTMGVVRPDPLGLGIEVTSNSRVIRRDGRAWAHLHAIGPITRGRFWEVEAIPEIRAQCEASAHLFGAGADKIRT